MFKLNFLSKKITLTIIVCCFTLLTKAQLGDNYHQFDVGTAVGFNQVFGAAGTSPVSNSINFNVTYNQTPFVNLVIEAQFGSFKGGDSINSISKRQFTSNFNAFTFRGQLQMGEIIEYEGNDFANALKNFYISTGVGFEISQITSIRRANTYGVFYNVGPDHYSPGPNSNADTFIPFRLGYEFKIFNAYNTPNVKIDLAANYNLVLNNNLDGYLSRNNYEAYTQISIGVKFALGAGTTSYRKQISQ